MLQRDLQNQMSENEKLKHHLQSLRENYTKFFGASIWEVITAKRDVTSSLSLFKESMKHDVDRQSHNSSY